jgi:hypothetical protein
LSNTCHERLNKASFLNVIFCLCYPHLLTQYTWVGHKVSAVFCLLFCWQHGVKLGFYSLDVKSHAQTLYSIIYSGTREWEDDFPSIFFCSLITKHYVVLCFSSNVALCLQLQ